MLKQERNRLLKNLAAEGGLRISYQRVQDIQKMVTNQLCDKFEKDGIVCPPSLKKGYAAIYKTDHDPSSTGAKSSFHGTSLSFFLRRTSEVTGPNHLKLEKDANNLQSLTLTKSYNDIMLD